jgi:hypothetical protein
MTNHHCGCLVNSIGTNGCPSVSAVGLVELFVRNTHGAKQRTLSEVILGISTH